MFIKLFNHLSAIFAVLNILKCFGWVTIPWEILVIPSGILAGVWIYCLIIATFIIVDEIKNEMKKR